MATVIGIDLGSSAVRVVVLRGRVGRLEPAEIREVPLPMDEDRPRMLGERLAALREALIGIEDVENATWAVALRGEDLATRTLRMPFSDRAQIEKTLAFELEGYVPFELDDFVVQSRVLSAEQSGSRVLCVLAPRVLVSGLLDGLEELKVDPRYLQVDSDSLGAWADGSGVQAIVDVGLTRTLVALCRAGEVMAMRAISLGGQDVLRVLVERLGVDREAAETILRTARIRTGGGEAISVQAEWDEGPTRPDAERPQGRVDAAPIVREALEPILTNVRGTLIAMEDELGLGVDELLLAGGMASIEGFTALFEADLGVPVRRVQPDLEVEHPERFALAAALARRAGGLTRGSELSFRQGEFGFKGDFALLRSVMLYAAVALVFFSVAGTAVFGVRYFQAKQELAQLDRELRDVVLSTFPEIQASQLSTTDMARAIMTEKTTEVSDQVETLGSTVGQPPPTLTLLKALSEALPPPEQATIDVKDLSITEQSVTMRAETTGFDAAATIESSLRRNDLFKQARKGNEKKSGEKVAFTMDIPLGEDTTTAPDEEG